MLTPEDELDVLDQDIGRLRRRLWNLECAPYEGRVADRVEWYRSVRSVREQIADLEMQRAGIIAGLVESAS